MPYSLKVKLGHLKHKGVLTEKEYTRLCNALDTEKAIDDIKAEIEQERIDFDLDIGNESIYNNALKDVLEIINKHLGKE